MKIEIQTKSGETFNTMKLNVPYISAHDDLEACVFVKIEGNRNRKPYLLEFTEGNSLPSIESLEYMAERYGNVDLVEVGFRTEVKLNWKDEDPSAH